MKVLGRNRAEVKASVALFAVSWLLANVVCPFPSYGMGWDGMALYLLVSGLRLAALLCVVNGLADRQMSASGRVFSLLWFCFLIWQFPSKGFSDR